MASIEKRRRADGSVGYRVKWTDPDHSDPHTSDRRSLTFDDENEAKRCQNLLNRTGGRLADAAAVMETVRAADNQGDRAPTVPEVVDRHITDLTAVTDRTRADYRRDNRLHIEPYWGGVPCTDNAFTRTMVKGWINKLDGTMSPKSIANKHSLLSDTAKTAVREYKLLTSNPCEAVRLPEVDTDEMVFLEAREFYLLHQHLPERHRLLVEFLVGTGARWGEATGLYVGDFALDSTLPHARIRRAWKRRADDKPGPLWYLGPPKTRKARRLVPLGEELAERMRKHLHGREPDELAFTGRQGGRYHSDHFRYRVWRPTVDRATAKVDADGNRIPPNLRLTKRPRVHDLRHTNATWLIADGLDLFAVSARLGHASVNTTTERYGHLSADQLRAGADSADRTLRAALMSPSLRLAS